MLGRNKILPYKDGDGSNLDIQEIFSTFQGEGIFVGYPSVFIRLGGCNLACKFCDTEFSSYREMEIDSILKQVVSLSNHNKIKLVVITGGEPMRQNISILCKKLIDLGFVVQIETNGTLFQALPKEVYIICSPKNNREYFPIRNDILKRINAFKFIISAHQKHYGIIPEIGQTRYNIPVYLQPMDEYDKEKNLQNLNLTIKLAKEFSYRISLQIHKICKLK